jgi:hypothetical protein
VAAATGAFPDKNAGTGKTVDVTGITLGGADAGNYILADATSTAHGDITRAPIIVTGVTAASKVYDGTTAAVLNTGGASFSGVIGGDDVQVSGALSGAFVDKNVGVGKAVTFSGLSLGGADAGNYTLGASLISTTADITPATITGVSGLSVATKSYDGTTAAALSSVGAVFAGRIGSDQLTIGSATASFADKNVGTGKTVTVSGLTLGGADAGDYVLAGNTSTTLTGDITPAVLIVSGLTAANKVYDTTTAATLTSPGVLTGLAPGETLTFQVSGAAFADKNAGTGKTVTVTGYSLTDGTGLASNYRLDTSGLAATADITPAPISGIGGITAASKLFNGDTAATLDTSQASFAGRLGSDQLTVGSAVGAFETPEAGLHKTVDITGLTLAGADAGNYILVNATATTTADITAPVPPNVLNAATVTAQTTTTPTTSSSAPISSAPTGQPSLPGQPQTLAVGGFAPSLLITADTPVEPQPNALVLMPPGDASPASADNEGDGATASTEPAEKSGTGEKTEANEKDDTGACATDEQGHTLCKPGG